MPLDLAARKAELQGASGKAPRDRTADVTPMKGLTISDRDAGHLAFDLRDILDVVGTDAVRSRWTARGVECVGDAADALQRASDGGSIIDGLRLLTLAGELVQLIDGQFEACLPGDDKPWLVVRAVDSAFFEVLTDRDDVLERIRKRFRHVADLPSAEEVVSPTWGDSVRIKPTAPAEMRPGAAASVCAITKLDTESLANHYGYPIGTTIYLVEFADGTSTELPEILLDMAPEGEE